VANGKPRAELLAVCLVLSSCASRTAPAARPDAAGREFGSYLEHGLSLLNHDDPASAVDAFGKAIALDPTSARAHNLRGASLFRLEKYDAAEEDFRNALTLNPYYAEAYNNIGSVYFARGRLDTAMDMFRYALSLSPDSVPALYSLGTLLLLRGKADEGSAYLSRGVELDPAFFETHKMSLVDVPSYGSSLPEIHFTYARIYAAKGDVDKTVVFLEKADKAGFRDWKRIGQDKAFEAVRGDPRVRQFLR